MSININRQAPQKNIVIEQNKVQKQQDVSQQTQTASSGSSKDSVQLTPQALTLNKMQKQSSEEPQVNQKRIETLKAAILNGDYKINTERLAEKLSQFEGDFSKAFG
ncbi:flagellar biosynthesis anti-sigma factor FlgM [Psychromonas antarctica]|jgi:negative regulator of flagellin synthesis FlgM|uniref:flagellar biosynthesis anti-sigma factor FlgM n=1 Tax=Psychromonas antarctica TaxID=67573 RepID=UPI001EE961B0|nr:flagellar biosynthesis anti-sigma factor FlgM [Psychromonas antarctica]MCG6199764.1 flagellar biosynthesis anti-sigma factor FlgM [Psychromonas antarctica]